MTTSQNFSADFPSLDHIVPSADAATQTQAARDLIARLVPAHAANFSVTVDLSLRSGFKDVFKVEPGTNQEKAQICFSSPDLRRAFLPPARQSHCQVRVNTQTCAPDTHSLARTLTLARTKRERERGRDKLVYVRVCCAYLCLSHG